MKIQTLALFSAAQLALVQAERLNARHAHLKRQTTAGAPVASGAPTGPPPLDTSTGVPPLASISFGMPTQAPPTLTTTYAPGATAPIAGVPSIPEFVAAGYPPADKVPDTNSLEVQEWLKELDGVTIPNIAPTVDGTCVNDPAAFAEAAQRGWWTCGGHTRATDIVACPNKLDWGLSFDDGPSLYSKNLLKKLDDIKIKATFFVVGSRIVDRPQILLDEYMSGHEISVHTWSHRPLTSLTNEQVVAELGWTRKAIKAITGVTPTTMRPPTGDIDDRVRAISLAMGLIPILWTATPEGGKFDSFDWQVAGGLATGPQSFEVFSGILQAASKINTGFISLQHDLFEITVNLAVGYTLDAAVSHQPKFNIGPIGKCMGIDVYRESNKNASFPARGADVDGDGKLDFGGASVASISLWGSIAAAGFALGSLLL